MTNNKKIGQTCRAAELARLTALGLLVLDPFAGAQYAVPTPKRSAVFSTRPRTTQPLV